MCRVCRLANERLWVATAMSCELLLIFASHEATKGVRRTGQRKLARTTVDLVRCDSRPGDAVSLVHNLPSEATHLHAVAYAAVGSSAAF